MGPVGEILEAVRGAVGEPPCALQRPRLLDSDFKQIASAASILGSEAIQRFEAALCEFTGSGYAVAVSSGTAALHLALMAAGVKPGDEVLCPALTFAATANAIVHCGAVPHFIDSNQQTLGVHPFKLRQYLGGGGFQYGKDGCLNLATGRRVAAIVPVHLLGVPCAIAEIANTATYYGITVIEDAAEALGSHTLDDRHCGTVGKAGVLSFNHNKVVTTGGGGAVLTNDEKIASTVAHLAAQAKVEHPFLWQHDEVGWNYRMPPLCAALGIPQMQRLERTLEAKHRLAARYCTAFNDIDPNIATFTRLNANDWLNYALLNPRCMDKRDEVLQTLIDNGYEARALFTPLHMLQHFKACPRQPNLQTAEDLFRRCVCLPSTVGGVP